MSPSSRGLQSAVSRTLFSSISSQSTPHHHQQRASNSTSSGVPAGLASSVSNSALTQSPRPRQQQQQNFFLSSTSSPSASSTVHRNFSSSTSRNQSSSSSKSPSMSMPATHGHSKPCCNIPPIVTKGYEAKGSYEEIDGRKTYVTGPADATTGILFVGDIFGYFEQSLQGADILAYSDDHRKYKVFFPDWFNGKPCSIEIFPPDTEEKQKALGDFLGTHAPPKTAPLLPGYVAAAKQKYSSLSKFAAVGFCWGGKVVTLATKSNPELFYAAGSVHPAMVDAKDTEGITVPFTLLASGDEPADEVKKFEEALTVPKHVEIFGDQIHGWMAARSDLSVQHNKEEYVRGYKALLNFFGTHAGGSKL